MRNFFAFIFIFAFLMISPAWGQPLGPIPSQTPPNYTPAYPYRFAPVYPGNANSSSVGRPSYFSPSNYYGGPYPTYSPGLRNYDPDMAPYGYPPNGYPGVQVDKDSAFMPGP